MSKAAFFQVHSWLGIVTGVLMIAIAWSGSLVVFNDEIEWLLTPEVRAVPAHGVRPIDDVVATARERYPDRHVAVHLQIGPHWVHTAYVYGDGGTRFLRIDPATAGIRTDDLMQGYTWNVSYFLRQLHVRLLMGFWGRVFVGLFGVTLVLSTLTSLWIYREWIRSLIRLRRHQGRRIFHMDLHKAVGLWSLAFNLMFGVTGAVLGIENLYNRLWPRAAGEETRESPTILAHLPASLTPGQVVQQLEAVDPAFRATVIEIPSPLDSARDALSVSRRASDRLIVRGNHPGAFIAERQSSYTVLPASGAMVGAVDARRAAWPTYLYNLLDPLHFGYFGERWGVVTGYVIEGLWFIIGLTPGVLSITGGFMWLLRQKRRAASARAAIDMSLSGPHAPPQLPIARRSARLGYVLGLAVFVAIGYGLQATVWARGWALSEILWQHWIVKPVCLVTVGFPLTLLCMWIGRRAVATGGTTSQTLVRGALGALPLGLLYLAATAALN